MFIIKTKNKGYTGKLSGVFFINGVGQVEELSEYDKVWFENLGATVEEEVTEEVEEELEDTKEESTKKSKKEKGK